MRPLTNVAHLGCLDDAAPRGRNCILRFDLTTMAEKTIWPLQEAIGLASLGVIVAGCTRIAGTFSLGAIRPR